MRLFRGRPRHGSALKESHTVCLDAEVRARLERLGADSKGRPNLSAGIAIVEHATRGIDLAGYVRPLPVRERPRLDRGWIVFELVDGPADPPEPPGPGGVQIDAFRDNNNGR